MKYEYKENSDIDAYGHSQNVIHFKFGDARKAYNFTFEFQKTHPNFCKEYRNYWLREDSLFSDPLSIVKYIESFNLPVRLYSNFVDKEFANPKAALDWVVNEYTGQGYDKLYKYNGSEYIGLDGEAHND